MGTGRTGGGASFFSPTAGSIDRREKPTIHQPNGEKKNRAQVFDGNDEHVSIRKKAIGIHFYRVSDREGSWASASKIREVFFLARV